MDDATQDPPAGEDKDVDGALADLDAAEAMWWELWADRPALTDEEIAAKEQAWAAVLDAQGAYEAAVTRYMETAGRRAG